MRRPVQILKCTIMKNAALSEAGSALNRSPKARSTTDAPSHGSRNVKRSRHGCEPISGLDQLVAGVSGAKRGPRIAFVYQDEEARSWAREISQRITKLAGEEGVQASWWKIGDLTAPGILAGAVSSALRADLYPQSCKCPFHTDQPLTTAFFVVVFTGFSILRKSICACSATTRK